MFKRIFLGPVANDSVKAMTDINAREMLILGTLAAATLFMGVYPKPFTQVMEPAVQQLLQHVAQSKVPAALLPN